VIVQNENWQEPWRSAEEVLAASREIHGLQPQILFGSVVYSPDEVLKLYRRFYRLSCADRRARVQRDLALTILAEVRELIRDESAESLTQRLKIGDLATRCIAEVAKLNGGHDGTP